MRSRIIGLFLFVLPFINGCSDEVVPINPEAEKDDDIAPSVEIMSPLEGQYVQEDVFVSIEANDESGIAFVEFRVAGTLFDTDYTEPYEFRWSPAVGSHLISARAVDSSPQANVGTDEIVVVRASAISVASLPTLPIATTNEAYSTVLTASGGVPDYSWAVISGNFPPGISLSSSNGQISGTTEVAGTFTVEIQVTDSQNTVASGSFSLQVDESVVESPGGLLDTYAATSELESLSYVGNDLSGITYVPDTNTFFMIQNNGGRIWEVDTSFNLLRTISSSGFGDSEDIVYLGNNEFGIVNEAATLFIGTISMSATSISASNFQHVTFDSTSGNNGYEGIAFDINTSTFWSVKELSPRKIVKFERPDSSSDITINPEVPFDAETLPADDLSAVTFDSRTNNLLILSDQSHLLLEVSQSGSVLSQLLMEDSSQHEGVALDSSFDLLVTSEPNRYRRYGQ